MLILHRPTPLSETTTSKQHTVNKPLRNIIFDLGGILAGLDGARCIRAFEEIGCDRVAIYVAEHRTEDLFLEIERGLIDVPTFCQRVRDLAETDIPDAAIVDAWDSLLTTIPERKLRCLVQLHQAGYRLFLLSNTNEMHWLRAEQLLRHGEWTAARLFEHVYLSNEMHMVKPNRDIYEAVLRESQLDAAETIFIDDREENCLGAAAVGIQTLHDATGDRWVDVISRMCLSSDNQQP